MVLFHVCDRITEKKLDHHICFKLFLRILIISESMLVCHETKISAKTNPTSKCSYFFKVS